MNYIALKMLFGDRAKYLMSLCGLTFAVMLILQQGPIFWGLMMWSQAGISNINVPIWVTDPRIAQVDEVKPIADTAVDRIRSVEGVDWAVPLYKGLSRARLANGEYHQIMLTGGERHTLYYVLAKAKDRVPIEDVIRRIQVQTVSAHSLPAYFFPTLLITGQGGLQSADFAKWFTGNSLNYSVGPAITLPIFQGGSNLARLDQAESLHQQLLESCRQIILEALREVADLLVSVQARGEQLNHERAQLTAAQEAARLAQVRYRKGMVNYLGVLDAHRTVLTVETQLAITERARLVEMMGLFKALGGGWEPTPAMPPSSS